MTLRFVDLLRDPGAAELGITLFLRIQQ